MTDKTTQAKSVLEAARLFCEGEFARRFKATIESLTKRIEDIPAARDGRDGKDVSPEDLQRAADAAVQKAVATLPVPKDGRDGAPGSAGKDADSAAVAKEVLAEVTKFLDEIPVPKDGAAGKDGQSVDPAEVEKMVQRAAEALPRPADGKDGEQGKQGEPGINGRDADEDAVVAKVLKRVPAPKDGRDADPEFIKAAVAEEVRRSVAELPKPIDGVDGKSVDLVELQDSIRVAAEKAVSALPPAPAGKDGRDASVEQIESAVAKAVAALPPAAAGRDGKDADPVFVAELVASKVEKAVAGLPPAKDGKDGASVDSAALAEIVDAAVAKAVALIPVIKGDAGRDADPDVIRAEVQKAVDAMPKPRDGRDGNNGDPGRDGVQIDVLPAVDTARSYPRATYAHHAGGSVRSFRTTTPGDVTESNGWAVEADGIAEISVQLAEDGRTVGFAFLRTSGAVEIHKVKPPVVLDRGLYSRDKTYEHGDGVTWDGSFWIAQKDGLTGIEPREGAAEGSWRLSVKKGRKGADAVLPGDRSPPVVKIPV